MWKIKGPGDVMTSRKQGDPHCLIFGLTRQSQQSNSPGFSREKEIDQGTEFKVRAREMTQPSRALAAFAGDLMAHNHL